MSRTLYLIVGAPGSGKTWVTSQLQYKFHLIHHDGFIYLKHPDPNAYVKAILKEAPTAKKPVLIEAPFSVSKTKEPLEKAGYKVETIYIVEKEDVHRKRYIERETREGRWNPLKKSHLDGHISRTQTYRDRAKADGSFYGTSSEVLEHMRKLKV